MPHMGEDRGSEAKADCRTGTSLVCLYLEVVLSTCHTELCQAPIQDSVCSVLKINPLLCWLSPDIAAAVTPMVQIFTMS